MMGWGDGWPGVEEDMFGVQRFGVSHSWTCLALTVCHSLMELAWLDGRLSQPPMKSNQIE
jgi:hypothetical protein